MPFTGWAAHYLGHGLSGQPSQQQLDRFCNKQYPEISQSPQYSSKQKQEADKLYKQYCQKQPSSKPTQPADPEKPDAAAGRIDGIEGPSCAKRGSEIRVRGRDLRRGDLTCRLESKGQRRTLPWPDPVQPRPGRDGCSAPRLPVLGERAVYIPRHRTVPQDQNTGQGFQVAD